MGKLYRRCGDLRFQLLKRPYEIIQLFRGASVSYFIEEQRLLQESS